MRQMSAKDKKFEEERLKLKKRIRELEEDVRYWKALAEQNRKLYESQKDKTAMMEKQAGISAEELKEHMERTARLTKWLGGLPCGLGV